MRLDTKLVISEVRTTVDLFQPPRYWAHVKEFPECIEISSDMYDRIRMMWELKKTATLKMVVEGDS